jgi:hypothetical protein
MNKLTKFIAVAMAATLMIGSTVTVFAEDTEPVTSVEATGEGSSEGHVDQKTIDITLPTVASGTKPFAYIMDPERLIKATAHEKYANTSWPDADNDTGVYFNEGVVGGTGDDKDYVKYGKDSISTTITNKSSHALDITVKAEAISADTDIPLVASDAIADAEEASLYLGLVVGEEDAEAISKDEAAEVTVSVAGTAANYKIAWNSTTEAYEYRQLRLAEYQALNGNSGKTQDDFDATWATTAFNLEGAVTAGKAITDETTAPEVKVTWSWADPEVTPTIAIDGTYSRANTANKFTLSNIGDLTITGIKAYMADGTEADPFASGSWSVNAAKTELTVNGTKAPFGSGAIGKTRGIGLILSDDSEIKVTFTVTE